MQSRIYPEMAREELGMDYKQFIREFERYRSINPDQSFQQALDTFIEHQNLPADRPELVSP
ncbi:MAG TPA: hypothetical protein V6D23_23020 [Candidatus Obscuribacterales bacterium]